VGAACLAASALLWPPASLSEREIRARSAAVAAQEAVTAQAQVRAAAEATRDASVTAGRAAAERAEALRATRADLVATERRVREAEQDALRAISDSFGAANDVVLAQNAAIEQANVGDAANEQAIIAARAIPAVRAYREAVDAAAAELPPLRARVSALEERRP
jgi:hypothetical protein